ncbi:MAG: Asp23/Gls24 family envelope stress response protein [Ktedonobacterales bacterium]
MAGAGSKATTEAPAQQPPESKLPRGKIEVAPRAIARVAGRAVAESYGVVGVAAKHPRVVGVEILSPEHYSRGIEVHFTNDHITIDLYLVLEYGLRITEIAHNVMSNVKFAVEEALGLQVVRINVNVWALRVNSAN